MGASNLSRLIDKLDGTEFGRVPELFDAIATEALKMTNALCELMAACDDEALDDADDDRHAAALDRQTAAMKAAAALLVEPGGK